MNHPMQPIEVIDGVARFKPNAIVQYMLSAGRAGRQYDLHTLPELFPREEWVQLVQLLGYDLAGFGALSYVTDEEYAAAERLATAGATP